ncbi:MAG: hypothetical protein EBQ96_06245 [Proteobacteria bacterium]|nr:hypothetical protein [Pseudomonadota bacterium]
MKRTIIGAAALIAASFPFNALAQDKLPVPAGVQVLEYDNGIPIISSAGDHQGIKAIVRDAKLSAFVVDYTAADRNPTGLKLEDAPSYVIYTAETRPAKCPAMLGIEFNYRKTGEYQATLDLTRWNFVPRYLRQYGCLIINNQVMIKDGRIPKLVN